MKKTFINFFRKILLPPVWTLSKKNMEFCQPWSDILSHALYAYGRVIIYHRSCVYHVFAYVPMCYHVLKPYVCICGCVNVREAGACVMRVARTVSDVRTCVRAWSTRGRSLALDMTHCGNNSARCTRSESATYDVFLRFVALHEEF